MGEAGFDGRVVIAGGSGFLGRNLARALARRGAEVVVLSRSKPAGLDGVHHEVWDARTVGDWARHLDGARAAVNLAGRTVDCIKTPDHCDEILRSRVESTRVLGEAMRRIDSPPPVWVQMSTAHIYGDPPSLVCDEDSALGYGLAPTVGKAWEQAFDEARPKDTRGVVLRTSFVLGREGGAMPKLSLMARLGLGGKIAKGTQGMSWIHEDDMDRLFMRAIENESMRGVYVATAPKPVSNAEFMRTLRRAVGMPVGLPAMGWMVRVGAPLIMRTDPELALYGRYCVSRRLEAEGFEFAYPDLESALGAIYGRG
ncbi:MAG: TIGR01777 family oxidoreductase [Phycisphaerales bacterium JB061]